MIRASSMASNTCCFLSSNIFIRPSSISTTCFSSLSPVVFSGGLKSRRGSWAVTRAVPGPNTYIFAFVFPLSLLVATIFTTLRISDKLDEDFLQEVWSAAFYTLTLAFYKCTCALFLLCNLNHVFGLV